MKKKHCTSCKQQKPLSDFYMYQKDGYTRHRSACKKCRSKKAIGYQPEAHPVLDKFLRGTA